MIQTAQVTLSGRLKRLSEELRGLEIELRTGATPDATSLQEFRQILDNTRMTAWTVNELMNAAEAQRDPDKVLSFLAAERLRRSTQMLKDLCADLDDQDVSWQTSGIQRLYETVDVLMVQLRKAMKQGERPKAKAAVRSS